MFSRLNGCIIHFKYVICIHMDLKSIVMFSTITSVKMEVESIKKPRLPDCNGLCNIGWTLAYQPNCKFILLNENSERKRPIFYFQSCYLRFSFEMYITKKSHLIMHYWIPQLMYPCCPSCVLINGTNWF